MNNAAFYPFKIIYPTIGTFKIKVVDPDKENTSDKKTEYFSWFWNTKFPKNSVGYLYKKMCTIHTIYNTNIFGSEHYGTIKNPYKKIGDDDIINIICKECNNDFDSSVENIIDNYIPQCNNCNLKFIEKNKLISNLAISLLNDNTLFV